MGIEAAEAKVAPEMASEATERSILIDSNDSFTQKKLLSKERLIIVKELLF